MFVLNTEEMRNADAVTINRTGIPGVVLMEKAGYRCYTIVREEIRRLGIKNITILCGRGNNGGDGYVIARYLYENDGIIPNIIIFASDKKISGDAKINLNILKKLNLTLSYCQDLRKFNKIKKNLKKSEMIIEAVFGTGIKGAVKGFIGSVLEYVNSLDSYKVSIDLPSGLNADTGIVEGCAIKADLTITIGAYKRCCFLYPSASYLGKTKLVEIPIPRKVMKNCAKSDIKITGRSIIKTLVKRSKFYHKGDSGKVMVIGGSPGLTGAPVLASNAALRIGAGLVTLITPESLNSIFENKLTEVMTFPVESKENGVISWKAKNKIVEKIQEADSVIIGPGIGKSQDLPEIIIEIIKEFKGSIVIDADGLNNISGMLYKLKFRPNIILTPHIGEFSRMAKVPVKNVLADKFELAKKFAKKYNVTLVLKDFYTVIAHPDGETFVNVTGNELLASGGSGDVLAGLIGGILNQTGSVKDAVNLSVFIHGSLADYYKENNSYYITASDLIEVIPEVMKKILNG